MIYICIPALNEARTVGVLLWKIRQVMDEFPRDYHVLVLDDGSTDDTAEVLEPYARVLPVTVLRNERTQGYSAAIERLIREAARLSTHPKRDVVVTMQADFTESPDDIPNLLKRVEGGADVVGTTVTETEGELPRSLRWSRKGLPWLLSRAPLPREIKDPLNGFRAYRVSVLKRALQDRDGKPLLTKHGWAANAELLLSVAPHVRRAEDAEVRLRYTRRERPTRFRPWNTAVELWDLARKAPRRLAEARAAAAAAPPPQPQPAAQPGTAVVVDTAAGETQRGQRLPRRERGPKPHRNREAQRGAERTHDGQRRGETARPADAPRGGDAPRAQTTQPGSESPRSAEQQRTREQHRQPRPPRPETPRAEAQPPEVPQPPDAVMAASVDVAEVTAAGAEASQQTRPKRRRPPRRRGGSRAQAGAGAEGSADVAAEAPGDAAAESAPAPQDGGDEAPAPARKRSRPRRPRRSRADRPAVDGGESGGEGGAPAQSGAGEPGGPTPE